MIGNKHLFIGCAAAVLVASGAGEARAQAYPAKPVRFIVPFAPGGSSDILARAISQKLAEGLGQPVVIDNRGGAGGNIGAEVAAKAAPDGYTVFFSTSGVVNVNPSLYRKLAFDPARDFAPVSIVASLPNMLVVHPSVPARSVKELISLARSRPGALNYASGGSGTSNHLAGELFKTLARVDVTHVPYKGGGPAVVAVLSGEVALLFATMPSALPHVKANRLRALAVTTTKRSHAAPQLPTVAESGLPGFEVAIWVGALVPAGTPKEIIGRLHAEIVRTLKVAEVRGRLLGEGYEPVGNTPEQMAANIKTETAKWAKVVKSAGIRAE
ncbi:MAG: tripartite tricarboxylate transporter substrate binding protein [Betaproteobacteria bacterium]|nr:tripartite tricarboxylate transporter substrate binding protein [Betaproteobacteria bacterium]MBI3936966.1 tripartite tricarboxylate transporter substrate binding protein [Betaproteobacteria bacterium]